MEISANIHYRCDLHRATLFDKCAVFFKVVASVYADGNFCISKCRNWGWPYTRVSAVVMLSGSLAQIIWKIFSSGPESSVLITVV